MLIAKIPPAKCTVIIGTGYSGNRTTHPRLSMSLVSIFGTYGLSNLGSTMTKIARKPGEEVKGNGIIIPVAG